ncbi:MAG: hypothetical protein K8R35_04395 [Bacteroidales bacterium]|nr:hypothetical protein [Bacteroidales bacterium]
MNEIPKHKNTVYISHNIVVQKNIKVSFDFIINDLTKVYSQLSKGHEYFKTESGKKLSVGEIINCAETAGNQSIKHKYVVDKIIENERIQYHSNPSLVSIKLPWETINSKSNTYVYYDFEKIDLNHTNINITIGIQFYSFFENFSSQLFGGLIPWKKHCVEEMDGLRKVLSA